MKKVPELAFATPFGGALDRRRRLIVPNRLAVSEASPFLWTLLAGELAAGLILLAFGQLSPVLVRGLALFLRF